MKAPTKQPRGFIIYEGPSLLTGAPIVAIALTHSSNRKTGDMVQTYILHRDVKPTEALRTGDDAAVCGDCKHRPANGGACYVVVAQGPTVVWKTYKAGRYPAVTWRGEEANPFAASAVAALGAGRMVRLGTYGDPAAVPAWVWEALTRDASGRTGYSHQWRNEALSADHRARIAALTMASVDDVAEAQEAQTRGLRYFRIRTEAEALGAREFVCPASEEAGKRKTCATCGACDGSQRGAKASPVIIVHGTKARRFAEQRSL